jgi:hypothetical protein
MPWSSNYTFLGEVNDGQDSTPVIYKPVRGERPLWDFGRGTLAKREVAAYAVSRSLGWELVPPTVFRNGPQGKGSVQMFLDVDQDAHYFALREDPSFEPALRRLAAFDVIVNNADRKAGHCLRASASCVVAIDQGLCFHVDPKLRTVIWEFAGQPVGADLLTDLNALAGQLGDEATELRTSLASLLAPGEVSTLRRRTLELLDAGCYPEPPDDRRPYPWPLV